MMRAFPDKHSHAFPLEGEGLPHTSAFVQTTLQSILPYLERNPPFSSSIYDPYMQSPWTLDGLVSASLLSPLKLAWTLPPDGSETTLR